MFFFVPPAPAITRRADNECLLCHVLWFDAFKTDQKTLMEKKDSAIVIAGSLGLATSEEMCVTCHDGYVVDSRGTVIKENPHHSLKKVPDRYKLPEIFRLDSNNEIYCGTCHTLHDFKGSAEVGSTPFLRMNNDRSQMCIACHDGKTRQQESNDAQRFEAAKKGLKFSPAQEIICQSCHSAHSERSVLSPINNSSLCLICHKEKKNVINSKHDLRLALPEARNIRQQPPSESGPCGACHTPHNAAGKNLWAKGIGPGNPASQLCLTCHAEKTGIKTKRVGQYSHPTDAKQKQTCQRNCHYFWRMQPDILPVKFSVLPVMKFINGIRTPRSTGATKTLKAMPPTVF
jgi:predicted CXXCH cytochrome family protein